MAEAQFVAGAGIAEALAQVAIEASAEPDLQRTLDRIARGAANTVPGAQHAHIAIMERGKGRIMAATTPDIEDLAGGMYELMQGPGPSCIDAGTVINSGDLAAETRWPDFAPHAVEHGIRSMMSLPLGAHNGAPIGSLSLYSASTEAFDGGAEHLAGLFAIHATVVLIGELDRTNLQTAVTTRDLIGTAKGILMCQHTCTEDQAFRMLAAASQRSNTKLREVAAWVVADIDRQARKAQ